MMASVKLRAESYKDWVCNVQEILENNGKKKRGLKKMQMISYKNTTKVLSQRRPSPPHFKEIHSSVLCQLVKLSYITLPYI